MYVGWWMGEVLHDASGEVLGHCMNHCADILLGRDLITIQYLSY